MKRKTKKEKKMSQPERRLYSMYARSDRGCKGELAQSQQVPQRSEWSSTKEIVSLEAELKQAKREITDLKEKMGLLKNHYTVFTLDEDVLKVEAGLTTRDIFNSVDSYAERSNQLPCWLGSRNICYINKSLRRLLKSSSCSII